MLYIPDYCYCIETVILHSFLLSQNLKWYQTTLLKHSSMPSQTPIQSSTGTSTGSLAENAIPPPLMPTVMVNPANQQIGIKLEDNNFLIQKQQVSAALSMLLLLP
ncbi:hypothetical protein ACOSP7_030879 [Xanthoceras sorbifolium]